jgi:hypothetical protein
MRSSLRVIQTKIICASMVRTRRCVYPYALHFIQFGRLLTRCEACTLGLYIVTAGL